MPVILLRIVLGFAAGALSHLLFQGVLGAVLYSSGLVPELVWRLTPVPPLGIPTIVNNMFWDGIWGVVYALVEPALTARVGRLRGGLVFGLAPLFVYWLVVLPLKGLEIGGASEAVIHLVFDLVFGLGIGILYWLGLRFAGLRSSAGPPAARPG